MHLGLLQYWPIEESRLWKQRLHDSTTFLMITTQTYSQNRENVLFQKLFLMNHFGCPTKLWDISRKRITYLCMLHRGSSEHVYESWMAKVVSTVILIALVCLGSHVDNKGWSPNCLQSLNRKSFSVSYFFVQQSNVISCVPTE